MVNEEDRSSAAEDPRGTPEFEAIFAEYVEKLNVSGFVDPETILQEHPDFGQHLLEDLRSYVELHEEDDGRAGLGTLGDYSLRRQIGHGGMGVVYEAWENSMDRQVALKVLPTGIAANPKSVTRFVREAQVAGKLNHPNIVSVFSMGVQEETPYYAMDSGSQAQSSPLNACQAAP